MEIHPKIIFSYQIQHKMSVNSEEYQKNKEYNNDLKEFFTPVSISDKALKIKKV